MFVVLEKKKSMSQIKNLAGIDGKELQRELAHGAKFVIYEYTVSIIIMTFRQPSGIYFVKSNESRVLKGIWFTLLTLLVGWWGIPWGPIYTIGSLYKNLRGGTDVTAEILEQMIAEQNAVADASLVPA